MYREGQFTRKQSVTVEAEGVFRQGMNMNTFQSEIPEFVAPEIFRSEIKDSAKAQAKSQLFVEQTEHTSKLAKQGPLLNIAIKEGQDMTWKSFAFNLNKGALKFILNSTLDTLPTKANLLQWKKTTSDKCCLCNGRQTTVHVLSACPVILNQGRLTWRHDGIVNYIAGCVDTAKYKVYADVSGHQTPGGGTIPADVLVTGDRPDIVIYDNKKMTLNVFELTVPYEHNVDRRHTGRQQQKLTQ